jgi:hypothetical protein
MLRQAKQYRMYRVPKQHNHDFDETHERFAGWGSDLLREKYGHVQFDSADDFVKTTQFKWHPMVENMVKKTEVNKIDQETYEIVAYYDTEADWDSFNTVCEQHNISHGWQMFSTGIYAILNK